MRDVRGDFPFLEAHPKLAFLASAASTQKPWQVIEAMASFQAAAYANVHRGAYRLSQVATTAYENARVTVAGFIGATDPAEVVFTRGTTTGLNLVAAGLTDLLGEGDSVVVTEMEHHANLIPWQRATKRSGAELRFARLTPDHQLDMESLLEVVDETTKVVAVTGMSNVLGTKTDLTAISTLAGAFGALTIVDGAQLVPHSPVDVE